jgi:flagellin-like protein
MKGVSPLISTVVLISIIFTLAAIIGPWVFDITLEAENQTSHDVDKQLICQQMSYDFVMDYGSDGIEYDFSGSNDYFRAQIKNYGTVNAYGFTFEFMLDNFYIKRFPATFETQKTKDDSLRPSESAVIEANITEDLSGTLNRVSVLNGIGCASLDKTL